MLSDQSPGPGVPEANGAISGGADTDVTLLGVLTEGEARHQVPVAHELTCSPPTDHHQEALHHSTCPLNPVTDTGVTAAATVPELLS